MTRNDYLRARGWKRISPYNDEHAWIDPVKEDGYAISRRYSEERAEAIQLDRDADVRDDEPEIWRLVVDTVSWLRWFMLQLFAAACERAFPPLVSVADYTGVVCDLCGDCGFVGPETGYDGVCDWCAGQSVTVNHGRLDLIKQLYEALVSP